ncbi:hypothetical protein ACSCBZ_21060 [Streptomyces niveiscabiei]|uniref:hypothetical protein n=1 Tax=Streptomyces TaxID=1883 RepID=UPI0006EB3C55|nr:MULTISPECIES: hypothetical protein [Streptomyces]
MTSAPSSGTSEADTLLITERTLGPLAAAQADRFLTLATHSELHTEEEHLTEAEADLDESLDALLDQNHDHPGETGMTTMEALAKTPYDFSPARIRYEERVIELLHSADQDDGDTPRSR